MPMQVPATGADGGHPPTDAVRSLAIFSRGADDDGGACCTVAAAVHAKPVPSMLSRQHRFNDASLER